MQYRISRKIDGLANITGNEIKRLRKERKLSRQELSNKLMMLGIDINNDGIYRIENGKRIVKDFELAALAKVLDTTETELLRDFRNNLK